MVFYQVFLLSPLQCTVTELQKLSFMKQKSQGKAVEVTMNGKKETLNTIVSISSKNSASPYPYIFSVMLLTGGVF